MHMPLHLTPCMPFWIKHGGRRQGNICLGFIFLSAITMFEPVAMALLGPKARRVPLSFLHHHGLCRVGVGIPGRDRACQCGNLASALAFNGMF